MGGYAPTFFKPRNYIWFVFLSLFFVTIFTASAWAGFTKIDTKLLGDYARLISCADYDNDGDLDAVVILGDPSGWMEENYGYIVRNDGNGAFTIIENGVFDNRWYGFEDVSGLDWGDYDNDGDLDLLLMMRTGVRNLNCVIYRNDGGKFTRNQRLYSDIYLVHGVWGDYDNDGDLDVLHTGAGWDNDNPIFRNDGNDTFTSVLVGLPITQGKIACGDFDNDGDLDALLSHARVQPNTYRAMIYRNDGQGTFTPIDAGLPDLGMNAITWLDFDNDGDLDIFAGHYIFRNNGDGSFTESQPIPSGDGVWGDFDNNGYPDSLRGSNLYLNNGNGTFTSYNTGLTNVYSSTAVAVDFDNDGDLDILLIVGETPSSVEIWRNNGGWDGFTPNTPPEAPTNLQHNENGGRHVLFWDPSFDNQTPVDGLNYNIRIGTSPDKMDILSPMADGTTGWRMVPAMGNTGPNPFFMFDGPMPSGTAYYWKVQAVDTAFAGSEWSALSWFGDSETLVVKKNGNGSGTVTSDLAGIDCGGTCGSEFPINGTITLTAIPNAHSEFIGWCGGGCHGTGTCTVTMDQSRTVLATFIRKGPGWIGWKYRYRHWPWLNWWRHYWKRPVYYHYVWWGPWMWRLPH